MDYGKERSEPEFILATTAVAHTFCRNHLNCRKSKEIQRIVTFLENNLRGHLDRIGENSSDQEKVKMIGREKRQIEVEYIIHCFTGFDFTERSGQRWNTQQRIHSTSSKCFAQRIISN